jgi:predicted MFS family arabinose efflux permease
MSIGETAGLAIGALIGGYLPMLWDRVNPKGNRYDGNMLAQIGILLVLIVLTLFARYRDSCEPRMKLSRFIEESGSFLRENALVKSLLIGVVFWGVSFNAIEVHRQPRLQAIMGESADTRIFGAVNGGYFMAKMLGNLVAGLFLSRRRASGLSLIGGLRILVGIAMMVLAIQDTVLGFASLFLTIMCLNGMMNVPESTAINAAIPDDKRASFLSLASLTMQCGGIIAGSLFLGSSIAYFRAEASGPGSAARSRIESSRSSRGVSCPEPAAARSSSRLQKRPSSTSLGSGAKGPG